jgi:DNA-binding CsgD family transcriptional regulator
MALAWQGDTRAARAAAGEALEGADELGSLTGGLAYTALGMAALASGDVATARNATDASCRYGTSLPPGLAALLRAFSAQAALAAGDLVAARRTADDAVTTATGWYLILALTTRARVAIAQGEPDQAERDAHDALVRAADVEAYLGVSDSLECLGTLAGTAGSHREAARLFGASQAVRQRIGEVRFQVWDTGYEASVAVSRDAIETQDFDAAWAEGMALSTEEAIAYAQRGRGQRKRPVSGWGSLTPTERDVVRLVSEGLGNKDIAARLFVSPRTVQTHLTHVYTKLGLNSRIQLVHEAARHS